MIRAILACLCTLWSAMACAQGVAPLAALDEVVGEWRVECGIHGDLGDHLICSVAAESPASRDGTIDFSITLESGVGLRLSIRPNPAMREHRCILRPGIAPGVEVEAATTRCEFSRDQALEVLVRLQNAEHLFVGIRARQAAQVQWHQIPAANLFRAWRCIFAFATAREDASLRPRAGMVRCSDLLA